MHKMVELVEPGAIIIALIAFTFLAIAIYRGKQIPQCLHCGAIKVRPSQPSGFWDLIGLPFLIRPYRCSGCRARFHAMRISNRFRQHSPS